MPPSVGGKLHGPIAWGVVLSVFVHRWAGILKIVRECKVRKFGLRGRKDPDPCFLTRRGTQRRQWGHFAHAMTMQRPRMMMRTFFATKIKITFFITALSDFKKNVEE